MQYVTLSQGKKAIIDDDIDYMIFMYKWTYRNDGYAIRCDRSGKKPKIVTMHREIFTFTRSYIPEGMVIDHINGNRLDNRIENLRCVTVSENNKNQKRHREGLLSSKYCGVSYERASGKWQAYIRYNHKQIGLGRYKTELEAHEAVVKATIDFLC